MHETSNTIAPLRNVVNFMTVLDRLQNRAPGLPGMGVFYGPAGFGKTWSTIYAANDTGAVVVEVKSVWTIKATCEAILKELGIEPERTTYKMVDQIGEALAVHDKTLIIDEADHLARKKSIEVIRDIYQVSHAPIVLVGEEALPTMLRKWERINSRLLVREAAQPVDRHDFDHLARIRCPELEIEAGLARAIMDASAGSARLISNNLDTLDMHCRLAGIDGAVSLDKLRKIEWHTGQAPDIRRFA